MSKPGSRLSNGHVLLLVVLLMGCGCASTKLEPYVPNPPEAQATPTKLRLAVVEFEDQSPGGFAAEGSALLMVPGILYSEWFSLYPATKFGRCLAMELRNSGLGGEVTYLPNWGIGPESLAGFDVIVSGKLLYDHRNGFATMYGLSFIGALIGIMGAPAGWVEREAAFEVSVTMSKSPSRPLFTRLVQFREPSKTFGLLWGKSVESWQAGEGIAAWSACPTEFLSALLLDVRRGLVAAVQADLPGSDGSRR